MPVLDIRGCLEDSPRFRKRIQSHEESILNFEKFIKTLLKLSRLQLETYRVYSQQQYEIAHEFMNFAQTQDDPVVAQALDKFGSSLIEVEKSRSMLNTNIIDSFINPLDTFLKEIIHPLKDVRKSFRKSREDTDSILAKYMSKKLKDPGLQESAKELSESRKEYQKLYFNYVTRLNEIEAKKKLDFMEYVLAYMFNESSFHHQSYDTLKDLEPYMKNLTGLLHDYRIRYDEEVTETQKYKIQCKEVQNDLSNTKRDTGKSGYLFEKKNGRVYQTWSRKYYTILNGELIFTNHNSKSSNKDEEGASIYNLRLCNIKYSEDSDRRFCFEVISPNKILVLQAETEDDMIEWVTELRNASQVAINSDSNKLSSYLPKNSSEKNGTRIEEDQSLLLSNIRKIPGNDECADCGKRSPEWACTNLGILVCIECSGIHRSLGVHVSKVRSVVLDKWDMDSIEVMLLLGNNSTNQIYKGLIPENMKDIEIHPDSTRAERDKWISEKYVKKSFIKPFVSDKVSLNEEFWNASSEQNIVLSLERLAQGADIDYKNPKQHSRTALHEAIYKGDAIMVEFLLQRSCKTDLQDKNGWTALHYAVSNDNVHLILSLLKRHPKTDIRDNENKTPLDLALDRQTVQSVTVLRLHAFDKLNIASPSNSFDFGFIEAMSSFKQSDEKNRDK